MATNYPEKAFYGTAQTVINTATDTTAGNFSGTTTVYDNTNDAAVPYARWAKAVIAVADWGAAPAAGTVIELWGVLQDVDSTSDDTDAPATTVVGGARYFGCWVVAGVDALQRRTITIDMNGVEKCSFYVKNGTAQTMTNSGTNLTVKVTPFAYGIVV